MDFHVSFSYLMKDQYEEEEKKNNKKQRVGEPCESRRMVTILPSSDDATQRDATRRDDLGMKVLKRYVGTRKWLKTDV